MLSPHTDSKFRFVLVAARRAEQLVRGARARVDLPNQKQTRLAMEEVRRGLVEWTPGRASAAASGDEANSTD